MKELLDSIVEALQDQQQALVLAHSLGDRSAVAEHLHAIKGMAGQFGLDHLYETIKLASVAYKDGPDPDASIAQVRAAVGQALAYLDAQPERQGAARNGSSVAP
jgi:HPt (histidine-containing phosphotransfer) domain-containing protein